MTSKTGLTVPTTIISTDGSATVKREAAWAAQIKQANGTVTNMAGSLRNATAPRAELLAVVNALLFLGDFQEQVIIYSDSEFVCNGVNENLEQWKADQKNGILMARSGDPVAHNDLWIQLDKILTEKEGQITVIWTKGHADHKGNNYADQLAEDVRLQGADWRSELAAADAGRKRPGAVHKKKERTPKPTKSTREERRIR